MQAPILILISLLTYAFFDRISGPTEAPSTSVGADSSGAVLTPDMPSLALSTQVKVPGSEALFPERDPSQMGALIEGMKTCQSLWKEASDKDKHYKTVATRLEEEVQILQDSNEGN